ncbi:MAG: GNAT family N-acetyltransferase [Proteobacteria bacterium]|nr:MAG: GNAT family N-acetyltransferase [Pseudomonadota bacterium]
MKRSFVQRFLDGTKEARNAGAAVVKLESTITAQPFYQRLGFKESGEQILTEINGVGIRSYPMELNLR